MPLSVSPEQPPSGQADTLVHLSPGSDPFGTDSSGTDGAGKTDRYRALGLAILLYLVVFGTHMFYARWLHRGVRAVARAVPALAPPAYLAITVGIIAGFIGIAIAVSFFATRLQIRPPKAGLIALMLLLPWAVLTFDRALILWRNQHPLLWDPYLAVETLLLLIACAFIGQLVSAAFKDRNLVLAGALAGALVDFWGVNFGSTKDIVNSHPTLLAQVAVSIPQVGMHEMPPLMIGPGDYLFIGIMFALVHRFGLHPARTAWLMWILLSLTMVLVMMTSWSIPGVVPMAVAVILPNVRSFDLKREEWIALGYAFLILAAVGVAYALLRHH